MEFFIKYLTYYTKNNLNIVVFIISFLESFTLTGLVLPGMILMGGLGTLIGKGKLNFYHAWLFSTIGCIIGDIFSYYFGLKFNKKIKKMFLFKKNKKLIKKIQIFLYQYHFITVFIGKFIGPSRPLIPIISGILKLSFYKFLFPNILACVFWPVIYFLPGILTYITVKLFSNTSYSYYFFISILLFFIITLLLCYILWIKWNLKKKEKFLVLYKYKISIFQLNLFILFIIISIIILLFIIITNPQIIILKYLYKNIFF